MATTAPAWFEYETYMNNKLEQLKSLDPATYGDSYTISNLEADFTAAGYVGENGAYQHFLDYGNAENVSPNQYFDADYYFQQKFEALQAQDSATWTNVQQVKDYFQAQNISAWDHYISYGAAEGINPSAAFDTNAYFAAKVEQLKAEGVKDAQGNDYTSQSLATYFAEQGINPVEHYAEFGVNENLQQYGFVIGGGDVLPETTYTVEEAVAGLADGTLKAGEYDLQDTVANLSSATYNIINDAKSVAVEGSVADLTASNAGAVLSFADRVVVTGALSDLITATVPDFGKPTTLLVTEVSGSTINLDAVTIAAVAGAQAQLDDFLARTDVYYADGVTKPESLTVGAYTIEDTVANIKAGDVTILTGATGGLEGVTALDTLANLQNLGINASGDSALVGKIVVEDSLANLVALSDAAAADASGADATFYNSLFSTDAGNDFSSFNLTNTTDFSIDAALVKTVDDAASSGGHFTLADLDNSVAKGVTVTINAATDAALTLTMDSAFALADTTDADLYSFVLNGSDEADTINMGTLDYKSAYIDGGAGADTITLGSGDDTVVLGAGTQASDYNSSASGDTISSFGASGNDLLVFDESGFLSWANTVDAEFQAYATAAGGNEVKDNAFVILAGTEINAAADVTALFATSNNDNKAFSLADGNDMILVTSSGSNSYVWYIEQSDSDGATVNTTNEVHLIATVEGTVGVNSFGDVSA